METRTKKYCDYEDDESELPNTGIRKKLSVTDPRAHYHRDKHRERFKINGYWHKNKKRVHVEHNDN